MNNTQQLQSIWQLHWVIFVWPVLFVVAGLVINQYYQLVGYVGILLIGSGALWAILNLMTYLTSSITISNTAVLFQSGILVKNTLEIPFTKIESIDIRQNIVGSLLDYGSVMITGTGGTRNVLNYVMQPLTCRRLIEQALSGRSSTPKVAS